MKYMIAFALAWFSTAAFAAVDEDTEQPVQELFLSDLPFLQEAGELQLTPALTWNKDDSSDFFVFSFSSEYGINEDLQVGVTVPYQFGGSVGQSGLSNVALEGLYSLWRDLSGWRISAGLELGLPSADEDVGEEALTVEPQIAAYRDFENFGVNVSAGLGFGFPEESGEDTEVEAELAAGLLWKAERFVPSLELITEITEEESLWQLAPGVTWLAEDFEWGAAVALGLGDDSPDWQLLSVFIVETDL